jgi:hypothetical protein
MPGRNAPPTAKLVTVKLVREKLNQRALDFYRRARKLSDIVKRRSIRAPRVAHKAAGGALSPFGSRNSIISNQKRFLMTDIDYRDLKCRRSLTASPLDRSYEASWSF